MTADPGLLDEFEGLFVRWQQSRDPAVLASAITCGRDVLSDPALASEIRVVVSANLCLAFTDQFGLTRDRHDIDEAVQYGRTALASSGSIGLGARFSSNLAAALNDRYDVYADPQDLVEAIKLLNDAVERTDASDPNRPVRLMNLATALARRFDATNQPADINTAITDMTLVVDSTAVDDPRLAHRLSNLARMYLMRSVHGNVDRDISQDADSAVSWAQQALAVADPVARSNGRIEEQAAATLTHRYSITADLRDIDAAIASLEAAIAAPVSPAATRLARRVKLAHALLHRYSGLHLQSDLDRAEQEVAAVADDTSAPPDLRSTCGELMTYVADRRLEAPAGPGGYAAALAATRRAMEARRDTEGRAP